MNFDFFRKNDDSNKCSHCGKAISSEQRRCKKCGNFVNGWEECGTDRCGNCHEELSPHDKYCRYCGTKVGDGKFEPFQNIMQCIYGPMPVERLHICKKCGYSWITCIMIDRQDYCPKCGNTAPICEKNKADLLSNVHFTLVSVDHNYTYELSMKTTEVGRCTGLNDYLAPKRYVSKKHAVLTIQDDRLLVRDLDSTNGTFVNNQRISGETELRDGDELQLGSNAIGGIRKENAAYFRVEIK